MRHDDRHVGKVYGNSVQVHGIAIFEMQPPTSAHASSHTAMTRMKKRGQTRFGDGLVERIDFAVVGIERLRLGMKLEAAYPKVFDETASFLYSHHPFGRINAGKGDHDIRVFCR